MKFKDDPLRICLITSNYPESDADNSGFFVKQMVTQLLKREAYEVNIVVPLYSKNSKRYEERGREKIYRFSWLGNKKLRSYKRIPVLKMVTFIISGILKSLYVIKKNNCKIIHAFWIIPSGLIAIICGLISKKPVIVTSLGSDILIYPDKSRFLKMITQFVLKKTDIITAQVSHMEEKILELGTNKEKVKRFLLGIDINEFSNLAIIKRKEPLTVISTRSFYPVYNIELLIRAIPHVLKKVKLNFVIIGDGSQKEYLVDLSKSLGIYNYITILDHLPREDFIKKMLSSDIYISTSLSDGASVSLLEAIASKMFPIVTDIIANREWIIDERNGFLVSTSDEKMLANKIIEAVNNEELRNKAIEYNLELIKKRASWNSNLDMLEEYYSILSNKPIKESTAWLEKPRRFNY